MWVMMKDESMNIESREEKQKMDTYAPYTGCIDYTSRLVSLYNSIQHFCSLSLDTDFKDLITLDKYQHCMKRFSDYEYCLQSRLLYLTMTGHDMAKRKKKGVDESPFS